MSSLGLLLLLSFSAGAVPGPDLPRPAFDRGRARFADGQEIDVELARTPEQREYGLMFRASLPRNYGMLFLFPRESLEGFWMKNTLVSLDIVFIGKDKRITVVHDKVRASTSLTLDSEVARVSGKAQYVLELPAGRAKLYGLKAGQRVYFKAIPPKN